MLRGFRFAAAWKQISDSRFGRCEQSGDTPGRTLQLSRKNVVFGNNTDESVLATFPLR